MTSWCRPLLSDLIAMSPNPHWSLKRVLIDRYKWARGTGNERGYANFWLLFRVEFQLTLFSIFTSALSVTMDGHLKFLASLLLFFVFVELAFSTPCGTDSSCSCYPTVNLITCAANHLSRLPDLTFEDRVMCQILILDNNDIRTLEDFKLHDWPQLQRIRVRNNPQELCLWTEALRTEAGANLEIQDDCATVTTP